MILKVRKVVSNERGIALAMALLVLTVLSTFAALLVALAHYEITAADDARLSVQCEALAESGWSLAFRELAATRFDGRSTHVLDKDGNLVINEENPLVPLVESPALGKPVAVIDDAGDDEGLTYNRDDGAWVWIWQPGAVWSSLCGAGIPEELRVYTWYNDPALRSFTIEVEAVLHPTGNPITRRLRVTGRTQPLEQFALFSTGELALAGTANWNIDGAVHANGNLYLMPEGSLLRLSGESLTTAGKLLRLRDPWGREDLVGEVVIVSKDEDDEEEDLLWFSDPVFDSEHVAEESGYAFYDNDPTNGLTGCLELFRGAVRDGFMGIGSFTPPWLADASWLSEQAGYSIQRDGAVLSCLDGDGVWFPKPLEAISIVSFNNPATGLTTELLELDLALLADPNGDGDTEDALLPENGILFIGGDCRLKNARALPADLALLSSGSIYLWGDVNVEAPRLLQVIAPLGRIWFLSEAWKDEAAVGPLDARSATPMRVVALLLDGQPVISESGYISGEGTAPPAALPLLENWTTLSPLTIEGAWLHLRTATLAPLSGEIEAGRLPWLRSEAYTLPTINLTYDRRLETAVLPLPLTGARIVAWQQLQ